MIGSIVKFELTYRLKRPATYIYGAIFLALGILVMTTDVIRFGGAFGKVYSNAPYSMHYFISIISIIGLFIIQAIMAVPVYRDWEHSSDTFLFSYPLTKNQYLAGRYLGSLLVCIFINGLFPAGLAIGELAKKAISGPGEFGPFRLEVYAWPFLISTIPSVLLLGNLFFSIVALSRKIMYSYLIAISFIVIYSISQSLLGDLDNKFLASMLDPFGITALDKVTEYFSINQKNTQLLPLAGYYAWNRLFWISVSLLLLALTFLRFRLQIGLGGKTKKLVDKENEAVVFQKIAPVPTVVFNNATSWKQLINLFLLELKLSIRNTFFIAIGFAIALYMVMDAWYSDYSYGTGVYPVTGVILENVTSGNFFILTLALLIFMAGEIVWKEKQVKIDGIYDAFPISTSTAFLSKLMAMLVIPVLVLSIVPLVCIPVQLIKGYSYFELGLYIKTLYGFQLPKLMMFALFAFVVQNTVNNKFQGHVVVLLYYLSLIGLSRLGLEHPFWRFGSSLNYTYSDMNGFAPYILPFFSYLSHWLFVSIFLLVLAFMLFHRGSELDPKSRFREALQRWKRVGFVRLFTLLAVVGSFATGTWIYKNTFVEQKFTTEKQQEKISLNHEKKYAHLKKVPQPKFTDISIEANLFPENQTAEIKGTYKFKNKNLAPVDTFWISLFEGAKKKEIEISPACKLVLKDTINGYRAFKFEKPLAPGDSGALQFTFNYKRNGFEERPTVQENGTFFNNRQILSIGYEEGNNIQDEDKRKEYGLKELPPEPSYNDTNARKNGFLGADADYVSFEATVRTAPDQIALAPGYLKKKWTENGRACFQYSMEDLPICNFWAILSARYTVYKDKWNNIPIEIYHHSWHTFNLSKMTDAVKAALSYYTENFGPYQHKQVRILEFPRYSTFAQSFDNTIPYSEGIGFISKLTDKEDVDYPFFVTAHEMAHQWFGHQVVPASTKGAQFLSESMSEYSALMVMRKKFGDALSGKFLQYEMNQYLRGRGSEKKKESTLMEVENQSYVYYPKGSISMYGLQDYLGEQKFNAFIKQYVDSVRFAGPLFTVMPEFYNQLMRIVKPEEKEFVDDNLKRITIYRNKITEAKGKKVSDNLYEVRVKVTLEKFYSDSLGKETQAVVNIPLEVGLMEEKKPTEAKHILLLQKKKLKKQDEFVLSFNKKPKYVGLDPLHKLIDENIDDNVVSIDW